MKYIYIYIIINKWNFSEKFINDAGAQLMN